MLICIMVLYYLFNLSVPLQLIACNIASLDLFFVLEAENEGKVFANLVRFEKKQP